MTLDNSAIEWQPPPMIKRVTQQIARCCGNAWWIIGSVLLVLLALPLFIVALLNEETSP